MSILGKIYRLNLQFIVYYEDLLPLPSGFHVSELEANLSAIQYSDVKYLYFLEDYLSGVREESWVKQYSKVRTYNYEFDGETGIFLNFYGHSFPF